MSHHHWHGGRLRGLAADVRPKRQSSITQKNRDRLRQFDDPKILGALLRLPEKFMREAEKIGPQSKKARQLARVAAAIELLLHIPMRISNLVGLTLGSNLKYEGGLSGRITHLVFSKNETKNDHDVEWAIAADTAKFLDRYAKRFRVQSTTSSHNWLFPSERAEGQSIHIDTMRRHIVQTIAEEVGAIANPHLFRSLIARLILADSPGALEDVRLILGDKSMTTVLAHYASIEPTQAARRHDDMLRRARKQQGTSARTVPATKRKMGG